MLSSKCKKVLCTLIKEITEYNKDKPFGKQVSITTKRLQKLIYFCEVEYMKRNEGKPLFDEEFYAWPSGPVIPDVYYECGFRYHLLGRGCVLTDEVRNIIKHVLKLTADLDTIDLVEACCVAGTPWAKAFDEDDHNHKQIISKQETYAFFMYKDLKHDVFKLQ